MRPYVEPEAVPHQAVLTEQQAMTEARCLVALVLRGTELEERVYPYEIPKPTEIQWHPVLVMLPDGRVHKIHGPLEAFKVLNGEPKDDLYLYAKLCCRLAMERKMSADQARLAFIAATLKNMLPDV
jgi:hypothetical protein